MYKIMFIDDDSLILRRLHQILNWKELGFEILPDATDGIAALKQIKELPPDVIVCDINMPEMDGLTLAEQVKKIYPNIQYILLTVNDSFGCAQQALNLGVDHYLLKPIDSEKILEIIQKIKEQMESSQSKMEYLSTLENKALWSEKMIREKFLNWLVTGRQPLSEDELRERLEFYQIPVHAQEFQILSIHLNSFENRVAQMRGAEELIYTAIDTIEDSLCSYSDWVVFSDSFYNINIIWGSGGETELLKPGIDFIGQMIKENLLFQLNLSVTVFYSRRYQGARNLYCCYYETKFLHQYTAPVMDKGVLSFEEYTKSALDASVDFDKLRSDTLKQLRKGDFETLKQHFYAALEDTVRKGSLESFNMLRIDFIMTGIMFLQENKVALQDVFNRHFSPLAEITERDNLEECLLFLEEYFGEILGYIKRHKISSGNRILEKCKELIYENISLQSMSVKWLSTQLYINENYLSRLFKAENGISLNRFIMKQRMEIARRYLDEGSNNLQQISQKVGFSDPFYFSKCFKKEYGIAPSKYSLNVKH